VHAVVQAAPGSDLTADTLLDFARTRLSGQKVPRSLEFRDGPVRDDAGKVRRATLLAPPPVA
jgi:bile acid-coenzyme A ligase